VAAAHEVDHSVPAALAATWSRPSKFPDATGPWHYGPSIGVGDQSFLKRGIFRVAQVLEYQLGE
jgi:hypothetical protein